MDKLTTETTTSSRGDRPLSRIMVVAIAILSSAYGCGRAPTDLVADLSLGGEVADAARQELLLAKEHAVRPLLQALARHTQPRRVVLADVLASLMLRVDDDHLVQQLQHHLQHDPDPLVRALLARRLGTKFYEGTVDALLAALGDDSGDVRYGAWLSLGALRSHWTSPQYLRLRGLAPPLAADSHERARDEALIHVDQFLDEWLQRGKQSALKAQIVEAESLFLEALGYFPASQRVAAALARLYFENGKRSESLGVLREAGMLLHANRLTEAPVIDGILDETVWQQAATSSRFVVFSHSHSAALPTTTRTQFWVGYTDEALFVGILAWDDAPDSLVVRATKDDDQTGDSWQEDRLEIFFAPDPWQLPVLQVSVNSVPHLFHSIYTTTNWSWEWDPPGRAAAQVATDRWMAEYELKFDQPEVPRPETGDVWGFNVARSFRGREFSQWTRTQGGSAAVEDFGALLFQ